VEKMLTSGYFLLRSLLIAEEIIPGDSLIFMLNFNKEAGQRCEISNQFFRELIKIKEF
jgi:hypothetical protein